ncbi:hypothetical protein FA95DRAFT_1583028 [Auriscalpium vulgare]|uniref:Uncharacterized protein n=1 Tax=Auriscalpium vulgare TaxID=40419 RepID=A0ACB8RR22_9AGAM|nr:hypothetical protein FA95DRAFT_1583028 [Auriscalpium vulgare]
MDPPLLSTKEVQDAAQDEVQVGGQTLAIARSYMWRDHQPRVRNDATGDMELDPREPRAAHISVTLRRATGGGTDAHTGALVTTVAPHVVALHVIRLYLSPLDASSADGPPPAAPTSVHFAWPAPPPAMHDVRDAAFEGGFFVAEVLDDGGALVLNAWNGPAWGDLRNGIDDMIDYNAVVEFEGGVFLKGEPQRMQVVV